MASNVSDYMIQQFNASRWSSVCFVVAESVLFVRECHFLKTSSKIIVKNFCKKKKPHLMMRTKCRIVQMEKSRISDILPIKWDRKIETQNQLNPLYIKKRMYITSITNLLLQNNQPRTILLSFGRCMIVHSSKKYEIFDPTNTFPHSTFGKIVLTKNILIIIVEISLVLMWFDPYDYVMFPKLKYPKNA
jgi:hypothetical protein